MNSTNVGNRIYGGVDTLNNILPFLVYIRGRTQCTGALIGTGPENAWVLTAKHCIDREYMTVYGRNTFVNTQYYLCGQANPCANNGCANYGTRRFKYASTQNNLRMNHIILKPTPEHQNIQIARPNHFQRFHEDIALVKLDNLNNYPSISCHSFANISEIPMSNNDVLTHFGYGLNDRMGASHPPFTFNAGILRKVDSQLSEITYRAGGSGYKPTQTYVVRPSSAQEGIRQGDSGGPMLWPSGHARANQVVAIHNWIADASDPISETGSLSLQEPSTLRWIYEVVYPPRLPPPMNPPMNPYLPSDPSSSSTTPSPPRLPFPNTPPPQPLPTSDPPTFPPNTSSEPFNFISIILVSIASLFGIVGGISIYIYRETLSTFIRGSKKENTEIEEMNEMEITD